MAILYYEAECSKVYNIYVKPDNILYIYAFTNISLCVLPHSLISLALNFSGEGKRLLWLIPLSADFALISPGQTMN